jgi:hypothetical protein
MESSVMGASTPARYLRELNAQFYLDDAVALMARVRPERPGAFLQAYFQNVLALEHTVGRDFEFVNATARNRGAFLRSCHAAFGHLDDASELMVGDLHQVVSLLCPTFPEGRVLEIPRLMREDTSARIPFGALSTAFFVHFSFYDHLLELKKLFVQPGKGDVPPEWRSVALAEALRHVTMGVTGTTGNGAPRRGRLPRLSIRRGSHFRRVRVPFARRRAVGVGARARRRKRLGRVAAAPRPVWQRGGQPFRAAQRARRGGVRRQRKLGQGEQAQSQGKRQGEFKEKVTYRN